MSVRIKKFYKYVVVACAVFILALAPNIYKASEDPMQVFSLDGTSVAIQGVYFRYGSWNPFELGKDITIDTEFNRFRLKIGLPFKIPGGTKMDVSISMRHGNGYISNVSMWMDGQSDNPTTMGLSSYPVYMTSDTVVTSSTCNIMYIEFFCNRSSTSMFLALDSITFTFYNVNGIEIPTPEDSDRLDGIQQDSSNDIDSIGGIMDGLDGVNRPSVDSVVPDIESLLPNLLFNPLQYVFGYYVSLSRLNHIWLVACCFCAVGVALYGKR